MTQGADIPQRAPALVLASGSPRRRQLLKGVGLSFTTIPADVDESVLPGESAGEAAERLGLLKCRRVSKRYPDALVLAADTIVAIDGEMLGKPRDEAQAHEYIKRLSGRTHLVYTGHAARLQGREVASLVATRVRFRSLSVREITWYVSTGEGSDKAGGYAIQGFGAALVERVCGCYFNVVGLSVATVFTLAGELGVALV